MRRFDGILCRKRRADTSPWSSVSSTAQSGQRLRPRTVRRRHLLPPPRWLRSGLRSGLSGPTALDQSCTKPACVIEPASGVPRALGQHGWNACTVHPNAPISARLSVFPRVVARRR
eukprot:4986398-Pyramimonas_sp.AAC.1